MESSGNVNPPSPHDPSGRREAAARPRTVGSIFAARIVSLTATLEKNAARVRVSSDPEPIHDLRVATRRLRAALDLAGEIASRKRARRIRRDLRRLGRALGELREADVNVALLREESFAAEPAREAAREALLASVIVEARRLRRKSLQRLKKTDILRLGKDIRAFAAMLRSSRRDGVSFLGFARTHVERALQPVLRARERSLRRPEPQNLHLLRIALKRFRYTVELLSPALDPSRGRRIRARLKSLQDSLGRYHDFVVLHSEIRRRRTRLRADGLFLLEHELAALSRCVAAKMAHARSTLVRRITRGNEVGFLETIPSALRAGPSGEGTDAS